MARLPTLDLVSVEERWRCWLRRPLPVFVRTLVMAMPGRLALALVLTAVGGLTEAVGFLALIPLLHLIGVDVQQGAIGTIARWVEIALRWLRLPLTLPVILSVYVGFAVAQALVVRWQAVTNASLQIGFIEHLRIRLHRAVTQTSWIQLTRCRTSDLAHAMTGQLERAGYATHILLALVLNGVVSTVYLLGTLYVSPLVTALVAAAGLTLMLVLRQRARAATLLGQAVARLGGDTYHAVLEHLGGIKLVKSYGAEDRSIGLFARLAREVGRTNVQTAAAQADAKCRFNIGVLLVLGVVLYLTIGVLRTPAAGILVLLYAFARVMPRVSAFQTHLQSLLNVLPDFAAVLAIEARLAPAATVALPQRSPVRFTRVVRLESISFRYEGDSDPHGNGPGVAAVSLSIPAGQTVAIVGTSGSGKTTLADILLGLIEPERGRVLIDDTALTPELIPAWRAQIGYVPQDTFLFHDTVRANLRWARPEAGEADIRQALDAAAADFVDRLPDGLNTVLGDRGVRLSGGERQRLALARALVRRPALLVLDEATSSLDSESERRIQHAIDRLHGQLAVVVITHRLTTVRSADAIYVLEKGRLVESGDWDTLLQRSPGRFRALCEAQGLVGRNPV
jgi:ATP-binding cassette, subfamily C, bacterial